MALATNKLGAAPIGGLLVSASFSLPSQVMPLIIATAYDERILSSALAGFMPANLAIGQLIATLILAMFNTVPQSKIGLLGVFAMIFFGFFMAAQDSSILLLTGWFFVGLGCGCLQQYGIVLSADSRNASASLGTRLAFSLILAGLVVTGSQFLSPSYMGYLYVLGVGFLIIFSGSLVAPKNDTEQLTNPVVTSWPSDWRVYLGLVIALGFFIGQPGFWHYSVHHARQSGIDLASLTLAIAAAKCVSALVLLLIYRSPRAEKLDLQALFLLGIICVISMLGMRFSTLAIWFFVALLGREIAVNILAPRLLALALEIDRVFYKRWLGLTVLLGMALGPLAHGLLLSFGVSWIFLIYALMSAFFGVVIFLISRKKAVVN